MSTVIFRNSQEEFIHKHVSQILSSDGYEPIEVNRGADFAVETYRNTASFGGARGGQMLRVLSCKSKAASLPCQKESGQKQACQG
ncbi:hypothetical protein [Vibrio sp. TRT 17S01]|uniref:hypothetical protein n=1 Tax=Vibrio sp. TRT 17S01 TaxID=3418505 RepID=UPI003CEE43EF